MYQNASFTPNKRARVESSSSNNSALQGFKQPTTPVERKQNYTPSNSSTSCIKPMQVRSKTPVADLKINDGRSRKYFELEVGDGPFPQKRSVVKPKVEECVPSPNDLMTLNTVSLNVILNEVTREHDEFKFKSNNEIIHLIELYATVSNLKQRPNTKNPSWLIEVRDNSTESSVIVEYWDTQFELRQGDYLFRLGRTYRFIAHLIQQDGKVLLRAIWFNQVSGIEDYRFARLMLSLTKKKLNLDSKAE